MKLTNEFLLPRTKVFICTINGNTNVGHQRLKPKRGRIVATEYIPEQRCSSDVRIKLLLVIIQTFQRIEEFPKD